MKDPELVMSKGSGVAAVIHSFINLVRYECTADINYFCLIYLDTSQVSQEEVCLPGLMW